MNNFQFATQLVSDGLCVLPAEGKSPVGEWKKYQKKLPNVAHRKSDYLNYPQLFMLCGAISGNLEIIDVDEKHDPEKKLFLRFKYIVETNYPDLWDRLVIEKTQSAGYHLIYRCSVIQGNQKLARRVDGETLIETRGEKGGIICAPSPGYVLMKGSFANIPLITPDERIYLLNVARSLTQKVIESRQATEAKAGYPGITPLDDYNQRGPVIELLESYGWTVSSESGDAFYLKRPNGGSHDHHATFGYIPNTFFCFSTSTEFDSEKPYSRCAVYALLKHGGDFKSTAKDLYQQGYGERFEKKQEEKPKSEPPPTEPIPKVDEKAYLDAILREAEIDVDVELPPPPVCLSFDERGYQTTIATLGNFSMLIGKAKSRKTFFVLLMLAAWIRNGLVLNKFKGKLPLTHSTVLHFDTEQGRYHAQRVAQRAMKLAGTQSTDNFRAYGLRKYPPTTRLELIERAIYTTPNLGIVVIDGIRDLAALGINDEKEATELATRLLKWTEEKGIHIMVVLHQNKNDTNARGHLGTELVNKAETVLSVTKDEKNKDMSVVQADYCRDKDFEPFGFTIDENGLPELTEHWELKAEGYDTQKGVTALEIPNDTHSAVLAKAFQYSSKMQYSTLVSQVKLAFEHFGKKMGDNKVKDFIQHYQNENLIQLEGKPRSKGSGYILTQGGLVV